MAPSRRGRLLLPAVLLTAALPVPSGWSAPGCPAARTPGRWSSTPAPVYDTAEPGETTAFATSRAGLLLATNGASVLGSADAGCTWTPVFRRQTPPVAGLAEPARIHAVAVAEGRSSEVWLAGEDRVAGQPRPRVWVSGDAEPGDGGPAEPFAARDEGLPPFGTPVAFALGASGTVPGAAYLLVRIPLRPAVPPEPDRLVLYRYGTAGWREFGTPPTLPDFDRLAADMRGRLYAWKAGGPAYAWTDGDGWTDEAVPGAITLIEPGPRLAVFYVRAGRTEVSWTNARWRPGVDGTPATVTAASVTPIPRLSAIATGRGVFGFDLARNRWIDVTPRPAVPLRYVQLAWAESPAALYGWSGTAIHRFDLHPGLLFAPRPPELPPPTIDPGDPPDDTGEVERPELGPAATEVTLRPGERRDVELALGVPAQTRRVDVYFLVDTTTSMTAYIAGLRTGITRVIEELDRLGLDVRYGVGDVKDFTPGVESGPLGGGTVKISAYRRAVKVTANRAAVRAALDGLRESGGGPEEAEAQTVALHHMLVDEGRPTLLVAPDQDAEFRRGSLRIAMMLTDASFKQDGVNFPTVDEVAAELRAAGVRYVGIVAQTNGRANKALSRVHQQQVALATGSLAPPGGIDCDADGAVDLPAGAPLVCDVRRFEAEDLSPVVLALVRGITDRGRLAFTVTGDTSAVAGTAGLEPRVLSLRREHRLPLRVTVTCAPAQAGADLAVTVTGTVGPDEVGPARITVRCRAAPAPSPPYLAPPRPRPPVAVVAVPPAPPPPPLGNNAPNLNPNPQVNAQTGLASEEEQEYQLATVGEVTTEDEQLAAVAVSLVLGAACVTAVAAGFEWRRRTAVEHVPVRHR